VTTIDAREKPHEKYLIFLIQEKLYAFPSRFVGEVTVFDKAYPLPLLPEHVKGLINRYSTPYALIDLGFLLFQKLSNAAKVVVLKESVDKLAFLISDVVDIVDMPVDQVLKMESGEEEEKSEKNKPDIVEASFVWRKTNVMVLNLNEIINRIKKDFEE